MRAQTMGDGGGAPDVRNTGGSPLAVLHVTAPSRVGGLERVVLALAGGQRRRGHRVHVAAVLSGESGGHPFVSALRTAGVAVSEVRVGGRAYLAEGAALAALLRELQPQLVHTHGFRADVLGGAVARRHGAPCISTVHGFTGNTWRVRIYEWLQRRSFRRFDAVVAVSGPLRDALRRAGVPGSHLYSLPNAWPGLPGAVLDRGEARRRLGMTDGMWVGWVGRLTHEKGPDLFVDALGRIRDLSWRAAVVGEGRMASSLRAQALAAGIGDRMSWIGQVADAGRLLRAFDLLVVSSRTEGTPILLLEAMAAGVPILASAVGGIPDVLSPNEALLCAPQADALAAVLREALTDAGPWPARTAAAANRLTAFDLEQWLEDYEALYRAVLRLHRKGGSH